MADPKSRKVVVVENPLLSTRVKEMMARVLFVNLQVCVVIPTALQLKLTHRRSLRSLL